MSKNNFVTMAAGIFLLVGIGHILRLANGWDAHVADFVIPMWASWIAVVVAAYLAYQGFRLSRKQ